MQNNYWNTSEAWALDGVFSAEAVGGASKEMHMFAAPGALAIDGDVLVIGAPMLDEVYVYERTYVRKDMTATAAIASRFRTYRNGTRNRTDRWNTTLYAPDGYWAWSTVPTVVRPSSAVFIALWSTLNGR